MPPHRILRIGVILGGNIIEERLVRQRETVSIGQSAKNSFSVPIDGLPKTWPLFSMENGQYVLQFADNMDGRLSTASKVLTLDALKQQGAQKRNGAWAYRLDESSRGKITVGEMTLLFQFVTAPPLQPRPRLPAAVRGTLADRIEPQLAIVLAASVLAHFAMALWAWSQDIEDDSNRVAEIAREYQAGTYEPPKPVEPVAADTTEEGEGEEEVADEGKDESETKEPDRPKNEPTDVVGDGDGDGDDGPDEAAVQEAIANTAVVAVLTGGAEGTGGRYGEMSETDQGASLDKSIENAKGKKTASTGGGAGRQRGQGSGKIAGDKGTRVGGPGPGGKVGPKKEEKIKSRVKLGGAEDLSLTDLDPASVVKRIRGKYLAGIKRCHNRVLKADPSAAGRVNIRFTVGPTGRVTKARVKGFDPTVDACIEGQTRRWRFSAPKEDGKPTSADFAVPLLLKPGG